jgi:hypothetical protein
MADSKNNKWSLTLSVFAITISIVSLGLSIWIFHISQKEVLTVELSYPSGIVNLNEVEERQFDTFYPLVTYIDCILTNVGNRPLSVLSHDIYKIIDDDWMEEHDDAWALYHTRYKLHYYMFAWEFYTGYKAGVNLPISLDVGESLRIALKIRLNIDPDVYNILSETFSVEGPISQIRLLQVLSENEVDIYGNPINYMVSGDGNSIMDYSYILTQNRITQEFEIHFKTSRGDTFIGRIEI